MSTTQPADPWHYPRTDFRDLVLNAFLKGGADALTLFGPRRTGKTEFLTRDIAPEAARRGLPVIYASYWQAPDPPVVTTADAVRAALDSPGLWKKAREGLQNLKPKLRIAPMGIGGEIDLSGGSATTEGKTPQIVLDDLLGQLPATAEKPALLLLDEVQELASTAHAGFVAGLRTSLDKRRPLIKALFTGSSLDGLRAMFSDRAAPFFHYATNIDMPPLGDDFVAHMLQAHLAATGRDVDEDAARAFFLEVDRSPYAFRRVLELMALRPDLDLTSAQKHLIDDFAERQGYPRLWADLQPLPRAVMMEIAKGREALTGAEARVEIARAIGETEVSKGRISGALRTLSRNNLAHKMQGKWVAQDPEFARYLRQQS